MKYKRLIVELISGVLLVVISIAATVYVTDFSNPSKKTEFKLAKTQLQRTVVDDQNYTLSLAKKVRELQNEMMDLQPYAPSTYDADFKKEAEQLVTVSTFINDENKKLAAYQKEVNSLKSESQLPKLYNKINKEDNFLDQGTPADRILEGLEDGTWNDLEDNLAAQKKEHFLKHYAEAEALKEKMDTMPDWVNYQDCRDNLVDEEENALAKEFYDHGLKYKDFSGAVSEFYQTMFNYDEWTYEDKVLNDYKDLQNLAKGTDDEAYAKQLKITNQAMDSFLEKRKVLLKQEREKVLSKFGIKN